MLHAHRIGWRPLTSEQLSLVLALPEACMSSLLQGCALYKGVCTSYQRDKWLILVIERLSQALALYWAVALPPPPQLASQQKPWQSFDLARAETGLCEHWEQS